MNKAWWRRRWWIPVTAVALVLLVAGVWGLVAEGPRTTPGPPPVADGSSPASPTPSSASDLGSAPPGSPSVSPPASASASAPPAPGKITTWAYQLQDYPSGGLQQLASGPYELVVIDLARDAHSDFFRKDEIAAVQRTGKRVLSYFEIGSLEDFRPEYPGLRRDAPEMFANEWGDWPGEYFVRYWDPRWWDRVIKARVDQAIAAGFDGVYLDTPLAYEEIDLGAAQGRDRDALGREMTNLIVRISKYAKERRPGFLIVPQNSPELRAHPGYTAAIDGIAMEELFYLATDEPCTEDWCTENLANTRALRDAGKFVLAVDYAVRGDAVSSACRRYRDERFAGTVTVRDLDRPAAICG
ncbi:MJ1477/TM1410 family putative glycoside hydrolase [Catenuloplanes atrovinosus]|uniref:Cysteinyl-tRNA synthetase n=1 Tax=Catenuloplanes atrovinosus TaxID=137266 RepID=A0AAE3YPE0_9ACTN|nr:MJ1477/TM1410 family putative glycoside hydrolase [Catenuloplanes atrovinosus]MDR7275859.1 cysteinyl-tRNA synthetase [Catenuloplanes atrovinosus]